MIDVQELYILADHASLLKRKRGHYFALQAWHQMLTQWREQHNISIEQLPQYCVNELKNRDLLFCDYFK